MALWAEPLTHSFCDDQPVISKSSVPRSLRVFLNKRAYRPTVHTVAGRVKLSTLKWPPLQKFSLLGLKCSASYHHQREAKEGHNVLKTLFRGLQLHITCRKPVNCAYSIFTFQITTRKVSPILMVKARQHSFFFSN